MQTLDKGQTLDVELKKTQSIDAIISALLIKLSHTHLSREKRDPDKRLYNISALLLLY